MIWRPPLISSGRRGIIVIRNRIARVNSHHVRIIGGHRLAYVHDLGPFSYGNHVHVAFTSLPFRLHDDIFTVLLLFNGGNIILPFSVIGKFPVVAKNTLCPMIDKQIEQVRISLIPLLAIVKVRFRIAVDVGERHLKLVVYLRKPAVQPRALLHRLQKGLRANRLEQICYHAVNHPAVHIYWISFRVPQVQPSGSDDFHALFRLLLVLHVIGILLGKQ